MSVVGIDPSLRAAGVAILTGSDQRTAAIGGLCSLGREGRAKDGYSERSARIVAQTRRVVRAVPADAELVVIEAMPPHMKPQPYLGDRWAVWFGIHSSLAPRVPVAVVNPSTRAMWATGKGNANKAAVVAAMRDLWPDAHIADDNEADALVLACVGAHRLGWSLPFEIKERHTSILADVAWPEGIEIAK